MGVNVFMKFRKTRIEDVASVLEIIWQAKAYLKQNKIEQWQNGYPNIDSIIEDIQKEYSYVVEEHGIVLGTMAVVFWGEPTYEHIYAGEWKTRGTAYVTLHRVAVRDEWKGRGIAGFMIDEVMSMCQKQSTESIRMDTHRDNYSMQQMMKKNGFEYCGIIYLEDGAERLAYERKCRM